MTSLKLSSPISLPWFCTIFYLFLVSVVFGLILWHTAGHLVYAQDDPYIHLALAENLAHGHYGINPGEYSSPSSSVIWPLLLIPFANTPYHVYVPLAWNLIFGCMTAYLLGTFISRWPPQVDESGQMPWWQQAITGVLLVFVTNLASLTMIGMEHVLQVLLALSCAYGMCEALSERDIPTWCLAAAAIAPALRYEDLTLTVAVCLALVGLKRSKAASIVLALSVAPLVAFSLFLKSMGLPLLPLSVLVKGHAFKAGVSYKPIKIVLYNVFRDFTVPERFPVVVLALTFVSLTFTAKTNVRRYVFGGVATLGVLELLLGRDGWFYRYEVYAVAFLAVMMLRVLSERPRLIFGFYALGLLACATVYIDGTVRTVEASTNIYEQQFQMHRFVKDFYDGNYAVNDLGLTSFDRRPGAFVFDVWGLASLDAATHSARHSVKSTEWLEEAANQHQVGLAIIYSSLVDAPASWKPEAKMCLPDQSAFGVAIRCVVFYSTAREQDEPIHSDLIRFAHTLPSDIEWYMYENGRVAD